MWRSFLPPNNDNVRANVARPASLLSDLARNVLSRQTWSTWQKWEAMTHGFRLNTVIRLGCFIALSMPRRCCKFARAIRSRNMLPRACKAGNFWWAMHFFTSSTVFHAAKLLAEWTTNVTSDSKIVRHTSTSSYKQGHTHKMPDSRWNRQS